MSPHTDTGALVAAIYNGAWPVRNSRGIEARARAIAALGIICRRAFNSTEDFEPLLAAIVDGLSARDDARPF